jgi:CRISPR-associated helicase Cas3
VSVIIERHCVASDPVTSLSPLQQALLDDPHPIRIASAPTGAGKSYAFLQAMLREQQRILFIVPTRRLAQNLAQSLMSDLQAAHWSEQKARAKVSIWSSEQTKALLAEGKTNISAVRIRAANSLNIAMEGGEMIIAIAECVSNLLVRRRVSKGQAGFSVFDITQQFHHVVFDEFHSIEARGFGLAGIFAKMVTLEHSRAKLSFLSATPINITPVLTKLGVDKQHISKLDEQLVDNGRAVHGDVQLSYTTDSLPTLLQKHINEVLAEIKAGRQIVMIYNSLAELMREQSDIASILKQHGINMADCLTINSVDDTDMNAKTATGFCCGRQHNPLDFKFLLATASVEMGVTFKTRLMFIEPGFSPLNFLQRYGRVARGEHQGVVYLSCQSNCKPWLRQLQYWVDQHQGQRVSITSLSDQLSQSCQTTFNKDICDRHFGELPNRAYWTTGLYWQAMLSHLSTKGQKRQHLLEHQSTSSRMIYQLLATIKQLQGDAMVGSMMMDWCKRFEQQAFILRDIAQCVRVIEEGGHARYPSVIWLKRSTDILERFIPQEGDDGQYEFRIRGMLADYILDKNNYIQDQIEVCFPHTQETVLLENNAELVKQWCREIENSPMWEYYPDAMEAAQKLVRLTGIVVSNEQDISLESSSLIL